MSVESTVKGVMDKYNIPVEIWMPIMLKESSGNPAARAITADEHSIGLFQINVVANPGYIGQDLTDPAVNAEIAARDFILPAYQKAQELYPDNLESQAVYTYKYGIRPQWTESVESVFRGYFQDVAQAVAGGGPSLPSPGLPEPDRGSFGREGGNLTDLSEPVQLGFWDNIAAKILVGISFLILVVLGFVATLQLFPTMPNPVSGVAHKLKGGVSSGG